ncbi:helix-turn-helix domain-containing protein [Spirillospora sp. CA-294931]|uniref:helix-turn-helix domain-containing protein n=1 Tax=Spirillospora sp. CA-294931 TaxID=3240042 RepID=UPI003D8EA3F3
MQSPKDLREALTAQGLSVRAAARRLNYDHAYLSRVLSGKQVPSPHLVAALEELCGVPLIEPTPESMAESLASLRRAEDVQGAERVRAPVLSQARLVVKLAEDAHGPGRKAMVDLAGQWANFAGWIELENRRRGQARKWFDRASEYAAEADDPSLASHVLSFKGYMAGRLGNVWASEGLTGAAWRIKGVHPAQDTYNNFQYARVLALMGDVMRAGRLLDQAVGGIDLATLDEPLPYAYWYSRPFFVMNAGLTHATLGHVSMATDLISDGLADMPEDQQKAEWIDEFLAAMPDGH